MIFSFCLWFLFLICLFIGAGYLLRAYRYARKRGEKKTTAGDFVQPVSIIIVCYNEAEFIRRKIESFISGDEWIEGSELIIASGGSTDGTTEILETYRHHPRIRLLLSASRLRKIDGVNLAVAASQNEILVFSDCRQIMKKGSVRKLVSSFADEDVATVSSVLLDDHASGKMSFFRKMLNTIAQSGNENGTSLNVFGALYAQRKSAFRPIPDDILFDDLFVVVSTLSQKKKLVQQEEAVIYDIHFSDYYNRERIERLARGLLVFLIRHAGLIKMMPAGVRWRFLLFKYLKLFLPFLGLFVLIVSAVELGPVFVSALAGSVLLLCLFRPVRKIISLLLRVNLFFMLAVLKFFFLNKRSVNWQKLENRQLSRLA